MTPVRGLRRYTTSPIRAIRLSIPGCSWPGRIREDSLMWMEPRPVWPTGGARAIGCGNSRRPSHTTLLDGHQERRDGAGEAGVEVNVDGAIGLRVARDF